MKPLITLYKYIVFFRLENCNLTANHIELVSNFVQTLPLLHYLSVNGNPNNEQNHHLLLSSTTLHVLSLKFCGINLEGIKNLSNSLCNNMRSLIHINLASNALFDDGMDYIANILRINRTIVSLNLADNKIKSQGFQKLLEPLTKFQLRQTEQYIKRKIMFEYYKSIDVNDVSNISGILAIYEYSKLNYSKWVTLHYTNKITHMNTPFLIFPSNSIIIP